jgi:hypothetical protein
MVSLIKSPLRDSAARDHRSKPAPHDPASRRSPRHTQPSPPKDHDAHPLAAPRSWSVFITGALKSSRSGEVGRAQGTDLDEGHRAEISVLSRRGSVLREPRHALICSAPQTACNAKNCTTTLTPHSSVSCGTVFPHLLHIKTPQTTPRPYSKDPKPSIWPNMASGPRLSAALTEAPMLHLLTPPIMCSQ